MARIAEKPGDKSMTVQELIDALNLVKNKEALVYTEGCDCIGSVHAVDEDADEVELRR